MNAEDYIGQIEHLTRQIGVFTSPKRLYGDFVTLLSQAQIKQAIEEDINTALVLGEWTSRGDYIKSCGGDEETHLYQIVEHEIENVFSAGGEAKVIQELATASSDKVRDPMFCAKHLAGRHLLNRTLAILYNELRQVQMEAELEFGDAKNYGAEGFAVQRLKELLHPNVEDHLKDQIKGLSGFFRMASIEGAHGLFVPAYCELSVGPSKSPTPLDLVIATIADRPELIPSVDDRDFEMVIARIFEEEGVEIELTAPTRDGGRDIICTRYKADGTVKRTAIEVKRYKDNKITYGKVTSFVGANILKYRDLIYVTSSSYTRPAEKYAEEARQYPGIDTFELNKLDDIVRWASEHKAEMLLDSYE